MSNLWSPPVVTTWAQAGPGSWPCPAPSVFPAPQLHEEGPGAPEAAGPLATSNSIYAAVVVNGVSAPVQTHLSRQFPIISTGGAPTALQR